MILGKKQVTNLKITLFSIILLLLGFQFCKSFVYKESIVFTNFDNKTFFTKPWDQFCIPSAPSCQQPFLEKPGMIGLFPIGCHCEATGEAKTPPAIPKSCYESSDSYLFK